MELDAAMRGRRSIRKYSGEPADFEIIEIIEAALFAPTACDRKGWKIIVVKHKDVKNALVRMGAASFIKDAPTGLLVTYSNQSDNIEWSDHLVSASLAIQNMLLTAHSLGLGACIVCHLPPKTMVRKLFGIPETYDPIAYITLGESSVILPEKQVSVHAPYNIMSKDRWNPEWGENKKEGLERKRKLRSIYYKIPGRRFIKPFVDFFFEKKFEVK